MLEIQVVIYLWRDYHKGLNGRQHQMSLYLLTVLLCIIIIPEDFNEINICILFSDDLLTPLINLIIKFKSFTQIKRNLEVGSSGKH